MLKYHIQTSGRSLHAQEIQFNDIRTTLQAMYALFDNCNSLHTNAYDEALTTPTEESVRRAVAIQLIINRELGPELASRTPGQVRYAIEALTDLVEEAVYKEFESLAERGGVLGAMETMYQRGKIQEESMLYETRKHDGSLPIVGVNTFLNERDASGEHAVAPLFRASDEEQRAQVGGGAGFQARHAAEAAPRRCERLQSVAASGGNVFAELLETVQVCSLGQNHARAAIEVGGAVPPPHVASQLGACGARQVRSGSPNCAEDRGARAASRKLQRRIFAARAAVRRHDRRRHSALQMLSRPRQDARVAGMFRRVPRITAGTTGQAARAAIANAPVWNFPRPTSGVNVPSGKNTSE